MLALLQRMADLTPTDPLDDLLQAISDQFQHQTIAPTSDLSTRSMSKSEQSPDLDQTLSELKNRFQQRVTRTPPTRSRATTDFLTDFASEFASLTETNSPPPNDPIDAALADFSPQVPSAPKSAKSRPQPAVDADLDAIAQQFTSKPKTLPPSAAPIEGELDAIAQQFQQPLKPQPKSTTDLDRELQNQTQQLKAQKKEQEQKAWAEKQRLMLLQRKAHEWLETLDPYSSEGIWFTDFARHYDSELAAAIDYLGSLLIEE